MSAGEDGPDSFQSRLVESCVCSDVVVALNISCVTPVKL